MNSRSIWTLGALIGSLCFAAGAYSDTGKPVAVHWWGQGMVSIESYWNLRVIIDPFDDSIGYEVPKLDGDLVLVTHEHSDHNNVEAVGGTPVIVRGLGADKSVAIVNHTLDRFPGQMKAGWMDARTRMARSPHAITVQSLAAWHDDEQGRKRGATAMFIVDVDGVRIVHAGDLGQSSLTAAQREGLGSVDVLCLPVGGVYTMDGPQARNIVDQVKPRYVIPIHYKTDRLTIPLESIASFEEAVGQDFPIDRPKSNTLAVRAADKDDERSTRIVELSYAPWTSSEELASLFERMEVACRASQDVFRPLSAEQMNWRPPNGTHTCRWNAEHMMGRQLNFFSQIYAAIDAEVPAIDLNPAQMPPDYQPAHSDWDGAEESRQMARSAALVRRFAYLLEGIDLDARAPGSRWTPRKLLEQMERHFKEHTANVEKKFELEGWPSH